MTESSYDYTYVTCQTGETGEESSRFNLLDGRGTFLNLEHEPIKEEDDGADLVSEAPAERTIERMLEKSSSSNGLERVQEEQE